MHRPPARPLPKSVAPEVRTESVWDYPRPPVVREVDGHVTVDLGGVRLVDQRGFLEVLETSHPPTVYLPRSAFPEGSLVLTAGSSWCEFKGRASYADVLGGAAIAERAAWFYLDPSPAYAALRDHVALYPGRMDASRSTASWCARRTATSTAAGSPPRSPAPSRAPRAPWAGDQTVRPDESGSPRPAPPTRAPTSSGRGPFQVQGDVVPPADLTASCVDSVRFIPTG